MRSMMDDRKGDAHEGFLSTNKFFMYIIWTVFVGLLIVVFIMLVVRNYDSKTAIDESIDADFILARVTNTCFAYEDPQTGQIRQNFIDIKKVTDTNLQSCFNSQYPQSFEIAIKPINEKDFTKKTAKIGSTFTSQKAFARYTLVALENGEIKPGMIYYLP